MDRFLVTLALLSCGTIAGVSGFTQIFHSSLTQDVSVGCALADNLTMTLFLDLGSDGVGAIYLVNQNDPTDNTESTFSMSEGSIFNPIGNPNIYTFSVVAHYNYSNLLVAPESLVTKAEITGNEVLTVHVMVKSNHTLRSTSHLMDDVIFPDDVLYVASCNVSEAGDVLVSTGNITSTGLIEEIPALLSETVDMIITVRGFPSSSVNVGDPITINLEHTNNGTSNAYGFYAHSCSVCDTSDCTGTISMEIIDSFGCGVTDYITKFVSNSPDILSTNTFGAFTFRDQNYMFIQCYINFCYTQQDAKCNDFCDYNSAAPPNRKRRDVSEEQDEDIAVSTYLRITVGKNDELFVEEIDPVNNQDLSRKQPAVADKQQDLQNTALFGTVVALATLLLVGLAVALLIFYRLSSKTKSQC